MLFVIFFIHFLNLLRFIECLSLSLLIKARRCEHKCLDPADGSSCYDNPLRHSRAGRSTKNGIIFNHFVSSVCVSATSCCSVYRWQLPKASFLLVFDRFWRNHLRRMSTNEYPLFSLWLEMLIWNKTPENEDPPHLFPLFLFCNNRSSSPFRRSYFLFVWRL